MSKLAGLSPGEIQAGTINAFTAEIMRLQSLGKETRYDELLLTTIGLGHNFDPDNTGNPILVGANTGLRTHAIRYLAQDRPIGAFAELLTVHRSALNIDQNAINFINYHLYAVEAQSSSNFSDDKNSEIQLRMDVYDLVTSLIPKLQQNGSNGSSYPDELELSAFSKGIEQILAEKDLSLA